jgi:hypothetical protein
MVTVRLRRRAKQSPDNEAHTMNRTSEAIERSRDTGPCSVPSSGFPVAKPALRRRGLLRRSPCAAGARPRNDATATCRTLSGTTTSTSATSLRAEAQASRRREAIPEQRSARDEPDKRSYETQAGHWPCSVPSPGFPVAKPAKLCRLWSIPEGFNLNSAGWQPGVDNNQYPTLKGFNLVFKRCLVPK